MTPPPGSPDRVGAFERDDLPAALRRHVERLEGERHPTSSPRALEAAFDYCEETLAGLGLDTARPPFDFRGETRTNLVATLPGTDPDAPRVLVGAHVDTVRDTPGADDNASGVAGVLEVARLLVGEGGAGDGSPQGLRAPVELAVFDLEERQGLTYRVGSRRLAADARAAGVDYAGALVLEMIGYRTEAAESQSVPAPLRWMDVPAEGTFLACIGDGDSEALVATFEAAAAAAAPELPVFSLTVPVRGWLVPAVRRSDNASFWSEGYPALMLTDTADLRNPHYHGRTDRADTLDYDFAASVVRATAEAVRRLAG